MRDLYATVIREAAARGLGGDAPADDAVIEAAEARLGVTLPESYKAFARAVGGAFWPVTIDGPSALERHGGFGQPPWLLPFASDGTGDEWAWDTRERGDEYPILYWAHDEPLSGVELEDLTPDPFDEWLEHLVEEALDDAIDARWEAIGARLRAHAPAETPYVPGHEDLEAVVKRLGVDVPHDYAIFTLTFGSTTWPFEIVDAQELEALNERARRDDPALADRLVFGRDRDATWLSFRGDAIVSSRGVLAPNLLSLLESRLLE